MRFHFGVSKFIRIKGLLRWILLIIGGLLAFFGIDNIKGKALTDNQSASAVKQCSFNGLFTDSNCTSLTSAQCSPVANWYQSFNCYSNVTTSNTNLAQKSVWYELTQTITSSNPCTSAQYVNFNVDILLNDQLGLNGCTSPEATCGPFDVNALNYPYWNSGGGGTVTTRSLTKDNYRSVLNQYWPYLQNSSSQNKSGVNVYTYSSTDGYQLGSCSFVRYGVKSVTFNCRAKARQTQYWIGQNLFNNYGGLSSSSFYVRPSQYVYNVSDPCSSSGDNSDVVSSINDWGNNIIDNNNSNTESVTGAIGEQTEEIMGGMSDLQDSLDDVKDNTDDIKDSTANIEDNTKEIAGNTTSCQEDIFSKNYDVYSNNHGFLINNGNIIDSSSWHYTDFIKLSKKSNNVLMVNYYNYYSSANFCIYDLNKTLISCTEYGTNREFIITDSNASFVRLSYNVSNDSYYIKLTRCSGMGDYLGGDSSESKGKVAQMIDNLLSQVQDMIDEQPVSQLILMPITLLTKINDAISVTTCNPYNIALRLPTTNQDINWTFTCPDYASMIGSTGANMLDLFMCFGLCWGIAHAFIHFYEELTSMKDTFDMLYRGGK